MAAANACSRRSCAFLERLYKVFGIDARFAQKGFIKAGVFAIAAGRGHMRGRVPGAQQDLRVHHAARKDVLVQGKLRVLFATEGEQL